MLQASILARYLPPGRHIRTPSGPAVHLHSQSADNKAFPDHECSSRPSSLSIRCQEGLSGPRVVQAFIVTRYSSRGRCIRTPNSPAVHPPSLSVAGKAFPHSEWSSCSSSLAIHRREVVSGPRVLQPFIFTRHPPPGRRIRARVVQSSIFARCPPPKRPVRTLSGPGVNLHSISATRKAYQEPEGSRRLSSLAIRRQEGESGPRVV